MGTDLMLCSCRLKAWELGHLGSDKQVLSVGRVSKSRLEMHSVVTEKGRLKATLGRGWKALFRLHVYGAAEWGLRLLHLHREK